ncbi:MAG: 2-oxoacid:acceptor oxidoreductase family protein [Spirochaetales bacterium]|nr:2-oxoacid:acceptor oxidoreductase family protein [Spirochaetales bacterium]
MNPVSMNIYLIGVGGQGIGLLAEAILRTCDYAGLKVRGVDTHGLAQRGGTVQSHIRIGESFHSPLIPAGGADLAVALERTEALRALSWYCRKGGTLIFYDTEWESLPVRLGSSQSATRKMVESEAAKKDVRVIPVFHEDLSDTRMQNIVLLGKLAAENLIPGVQAHHYEQALEDLLAGSSLERNLDLFSSVAG